MHYRMALGPGKYDEAATAARVATGAQGIILIVLNGTHGSGFSVQTSDPQLQHQLPRLLLDVAQGVGADLKIRAPDKIITDHGVIYFERRPDYCDRGRVLVHVQPEHHPSCKPCNVDTHDLWPRFYFDEARALAEVRAWMNVRGWTPVET